MVLNMEQWRIFLVTGGTVFTVSLVAWRVCRHILYRDYWLEEEKDTEHIVPVSPNNEDHFQEEPGLSNSIIAHNIPKKGESKLGLYSPRRQYLEVGMYTFLILMMISSHIIVLGGFLCNSRTESVFATLGASVFFSYVIVNLPKEKHASSSDENVIIKTECFYEHIHETFLVVFFVFIGQVSLTAYLVFFVVTNQEDVYDFPDDDEIGVLDRKNIVNLFLAISVDYVRYREFKSGFVPLRISPMLHDGFSEEKIVLKKVDSSFHYFIQPTQVNLYMRAVMRTISEVVIPLFILIIAPVVLTFTKKPIDVLLNILGLTFIGLLDHSFGVAEYRIIKK